MNDDEIKEIIKNDKEINEMSIKIDLLKGTDKLVAEDKLLEMVRDKAISLTRKSEQERILKLIDELNSISYSVPETIDLFKKHLKQKIK